MKILLILCITFLAKVSANTELNKISEHNSGQRGTLDQYQKTVSGDYNSFNTDETFTLNNYIISPSIVFDFNKSLFPLLYYELNQDQINVSTLRSSLHSDHEYYNKIASSKRTQLSSPIGNKFWKSQKFIYWNKQSLDEYINSKFSDQKSSPYLSTEKNTISYSDFTYAGTRRFTISGDLPNSTTQINPLHASLMAGVTVITGITLHGNQSAAWWDGKGRSFYFDDDWDDALFADKIGHFLGGYFISYLARDAFVYTGVSWDQSILFGSLLGIISQTYVEFKDGHAENTGFSVSDLGADIAGATYFYL